MGINIWEASASTVKHRNSWCPICSDPNKMEMNDIINYLSEWKDEEKNSFRKRIFSKIIIILSGIN